MLALVFDTETTGLIDNPARRMEIQPEIISYACCWIGLSTGKISGEYYETFKPTKPISQEITKITGFTNEMLKDKYPIWYHLDKIIERIEEAPLIIGQNIAYDMSMIELECKRYNKTIKWPTKIDLVANSIHLKGYRLSLTDLHMELFGTKFEDAHRADADVRSTAKCAAEMFKRGLL